MNKILILITLLVAGCAAPVSTSSTEQSIDGYCTTSLGKIQCDPDGGFCADACMDYNGETGYCPEYTWGELNNCANLCHTAWGIAHCDASCYPTNFHYCVLGFPP